MSEEFYVDETTGNWSTMKSPIHPTRYFSDFGDAVRYGEMVKERLKSEQEMKQQLENMKNSSGGGSSSGASSSNAYGAGLAFIFLLPFRLISQIIRIIKIMWSWIFSKKSTIGKRLSGLVLLIVFILGISYGGHFIYNKYFKIDGYVTTKIPILEYAAKIDEPSGNEIGKIADDVVLKVESISKTKNVTWIKVYKLKNNEPILTWILLPDVVKINEDNKYLVFNKNSKTWNSYYAQIDSKNKEILVKYQNDFKESIKDIEISYSTDKVLKETISSTSFIFPKSGYLELYKADDNSFYYIDKNLKSEFLKKVRIVEKNYKENKIKYFPNEKATSLKE